MSHLDPDLDPTMLNIKLVRVIFIYYNVLKWHVCTCSSTMFCVT